MFENTTDLKNQITSLNAQVKSLQDQMDGLSEDNSDLAQGKLSAEEKVRIMTEARDPAKIDEQALLVARDIEDLFARGWDNAGQRRAAIQCRVVQLIKSVLTGESNE